MASFNLTVPDTALAVLASFEEELLEYGLDPTKPDPIGSFLNNQAYEALRGLISQIAYGKAEEKNAADAAATVARAFPDTVG